MQPKVRVRAIGALTLRSVRAGAGALGLTLALSSDDLGPRAALLIVGALAVIGSLASHGRRGSTLAAIGLSLAFVTLGRMSAGPIGAAAMTGVVALAFWARLRLRDAVSGVAAFGALIAVLAAASPALALSFWLVGWAIVLLDALANRLTAVLRAAPPPAQAAAKNGSLPVDALSAGS